MADRDLSGNKSGDKPGGRLPRDPPREVPRDLPRESGGGNTIGREWLGSSRSLRRIADRFTDELARRKPIAAPPAEKLGRLPVRAKRPETKAARPTAVGSPDRTRPVAPAEVGALLDLGVADGAVAAYLLDPANLDAPRRPRPPSLHATVPSFRAPVLYRALGRVSAAAMRRQARQLIFQARRNSDPERRTSLAEHAFALAQAAEDLEGRAAAAQGRANDDDAGAPSARSRRWQLRAEEYRTLADALPPGTARDSYLHLARAYDTLAAGPSPPPT